MGLLEGREGSAWKRETIYIGLMKERWIVYDSREH
jgi:hypothetical protein